MWGATIWIAAIAATCLMVKPNLHKSSKPLSILAHLCMMLPFFALASRFLVNDTTIQYVAAFGGADLPLKYRFAATWAAREGPILMWVVWLTILTWIWRNPMVGRSNESSKSAALRLRIIHGFSLTLLLLAIVLQPFKETPPFFSGAGLNELLQTDLMVIHPPLIFLAYSFCIFIAAIALSAIFTDETDGISDRMLTLARPGFLITTLGIGLGGLWAYLILDWGGYWAWDPVETGSFLPWLALVAMLHLRTRPGKTSDKTWIGAGLLVGSLALFATLVTRAGGVWASSVHTFVTSDSGTPPQDAFSRMLLLKSDKVAGVEIMTYLMFILILVGAWALVSRNGNQNNQSNPSTVFLLIIPTAGAFLAIFAGADIYSWIPDFVFLILTVCFILIQQTKPTDKSTGKGVWNYYQNQYVPIIAIFVLAVFLLIPQVFFVLIFTVIFIPMYYSSNAAKEWIWATFGVMLSLAAAWSGMVEIIPAAVVILIYLAPFMLVDVDETDKLDFFSKKTQQKIALWGSVMLISMYLILTLVILLESVDTVNFDAHELYGTPFILAFAIAMLVYTNRKNNPHKTMAIIGAVLLFSLIMAVFNSATLGLDSATEVSQYVSRGTIAWVSLPMLLVATGPLLFEINSNITKNSKKPVLKRIPLGAHIVHFGLVLLLIGHIMTTVLVDRGDASHRITLTKNEIIRDGDFGFEFTELIATEDDLEVGDRYVGVSITVYEFKDGVAEEIGVVEPGMLGFDKTGSARSEVDILTRWSGDIVFIFDGTQAQGLMQQTASEGLDSVNLVRVTVYDLPASHLVWLGWVTMMLGMLVVVYAGHSKIKALNDTKSKIAEQE